MLELEDRENLKFSDEIRECSSHSLGKVSVSPLCVCVFVFILSPRKLAGRGGNEKGIGISFPSPLWGGVGNMCMFCPSFYSKFYKS